MDLAEAHIRNAGYGRFSFRDLAAEIGIKSASVHHHFPTKATIAAAVARRYGDRFLAAVARRPNESAGDAISVYRLAFRKALSRPRLTSGIGTKRNCLGATRHFRSSGQTGRTINLAMTAARVESPEGISPPGLPEPCMTLSSHTAPDVRPLP